MITVVELEGCNGEWFNLTTGDRGVYLATDVKGAFYDPPVKIVYEEPGNYPGARYLSHRILRRDIVFAVEILNDANAGENSWISRDSEFRKALSFDRDAKLHITTQESGHRYLKIRLAESPEVDMFHDPQMRSINRTTVVAVAGDPFWYEDDEVKTVKTKRDTRFDPSPFDGIFQFSKQPSEKLYLTVDDLNPTDQYIWPKWVVPGATERVPEFPWPFPPGIPIPWERAPFTQFVLPDYSFEDESKANRRLKSPGLIYGENCVVDSDPRVEQWTSESGSQVWARTNGVRFRHPIPPWTEKKKFEIDVSGVKAGQLITLRLPRPWSRAWGMH